MNLHYPHYFDIAISSYCQAFCIGCQRNTDTGEKIPELIESNMTYENFCYIMDQVDQLDKCSGIQFCGEFGDPMMHPEIEKFIDRAMLTTNNLLINTNGGLRQPKWYAYIAEKYSDKNIQIEWGIDGTDHDTNWLYRKGVNWNRAMDNMKSWVSAGGGGKWAFLVFSWNYHQIPNAIKMAKEIGIKITFSITISDNGLDGIKPGPDLDAAREILAEYDYD